MPPANLELTINGAAPHPAGLGRLEQLMGRALPAGHYWYDVHCGAWGLWGGPSAGFLPPGMDLAAALPQEASGGLTPVIVNGRALHPADVQAMNQLLIRVGSHCMPGRWRVDAAGTLSAEGGPPLVNLAALAAAGGGGGGPWSTSFSAGNSSGGAGYVALPGGGHVSFGM